MNYGVQVIFSPTLRAIVYSVPSFEDQSHGDPDRTISGCLVLIVKQITTTVEELLGRCKKANLVLEIDISILMMLIVKQIRTIGPLGMAYLRLEFCLLWLMW